VNESVLDIRALTRRFGAPTAVDALTASVSAGEVFGLLGSNGAGKSTAIKMLTTLLPPSSGYGSGNTIRFRKRSLSVLPS